MARRTKEDALATRHRLLDAAELLFQARGVSRTSLNDIALQAGATRGAIYWHFKDKADLFNAMIARVTLPLEASFQRMGQGKGPDPMQDLRDALLDALRRVAGDAQVRRVFEVATHKVEYVDEMRAVRLRHLAVRDECVVQLGKGLRLAASMRGGRLPVPAAAAARGLHAMIDGLIGNWLLEPAAFDLLKTGRHALDAYLAGLGLSLQRLADGRARGTRGPPRDPVNKG